MTFDLATAAPEPLLEAVTWYSWAARLHHFWLLP